MPCYTVQTMSVEFQAKHADLLTDAIKALGWGLRQRGNTYYVDTPNGAIAIDLDRQQAELRPEQQDRLNELKRAYSTQAIKRVAALKKWQVVARSATTGVMMKRIGAVQ